MIEKKEKIIQKMLLDKRKKKEETWIRILNLG